MFEFLKRNKELKEKINDYKSSLLMNTEVSDKFLNQDEKMLELFGDTKKISKKLNILIVCDTNGNLDELIFADYVYRNKNYDVCVLLGNIGLKDVEIVKKYIPNNKLYSTQVYDEVRNIDGDVIKVNGVNVLIVGKRQFTQEESISFYDSLPKAEVVLSYDNKYINEKEQGFFGINYYLYKNKVPFFIQGNIFNHYKDTMQNGTTIIGTFEFEYLELE